MKRTVKMLNQSFQGFHHQSWSQAINQLENAGIDYVLVTILGTAGSVPRASGTKMVVSADDIFDTVGGGHLEFEVINKARKLLADGQKSQLIEQFKLGTNLGQCCGGIAVIMFEVIPSQNLLLDVYGAGHVAQALMTIIAQLPIKARWIDSRADVFPNDIPQNVIKIIDDQPTEQAKLASANTASLILTHNHQLDFELVNTILKKSDGLWLGVIGSTTKAKRFKNRLAHRDFSSEQIEKMVCPVGLDNITGKRPMEVAVSISAQLMTIYQTIKQQPMKREGMQWQELKQALISHDPHEKITQKISGQTKAELNQ
jgi:xanthine dehydrogenase accessory factor